MTRSSSAAPILIAALLLLTPLGTYVAGYLWLGERSDWYSTQTNAHEVIERSFPTLPLALIFRPAGNVESWLRGIEVEISLADE